MKANSANRTVRIDFITLEEDRGVVSSRSVTKGGLIHRIDEAFRRLQSSNWRTGHEVFIACCGHCDMAWQGFGSSRPKGIIHYSVDGVGEKHDPLGELDLQFDSTDVPESPAYTTKLEALGCELLEVLKAVGVSVGPVRVEGLSGRTISVGLPALTLPLESHANWSLCNETI
jgi:hypothetical protein